MLLLLLLLHLVLCGAHFEESLEGALFGRKCGTRFGGGIILCGLQELCGLLHFGLGFLCECGELWGIGGLFERLLQLFDGLQL